MFDAPVETAPSILQLQTAAYAAVLLASLFLLKRAIFPHYLRDVPVPEGASRLWGHEKQVFDMGVGQAYTKWLKEVGSHVYRIKAALFQPDILVIADPFALTHIMQRNIYNYPHGDISRPRIKRMLGKSLGWVEGESEHKRMRQLVSSTLTPEAVKKGSPEIFAAAENFVNSLEAHVASEGGASVVKISDWTARVTLDVIGRFGFGHDFEGGNSEHSERILGAWRNMVKMAISERGFYTLIFLRRFGFINNLPLRVLEKQGDVKRTIHEGIAQELIRRDKDVDRASLGNDLLSRLLIALKSDKLSLDELKDHISMFIMGGSETTSQTISYGIWELAKSPEVQRKLRQEVITQSDHLSYDDVQNKMPYLEAVAREVLRLHPAGPYMERVATKDDVLPLRHPIVTKNGREIKQIPIKTGQTILIPIYSIGREDSVWGDGDAFRPERWLEELPPHNSLPTGWSKLLVFSDGPRQCVGYRLAVFEFKVMIAALIMKFEFKDTGAVIVNKVASSIQPVCAEYGDDNPVLPIEVRVI